MHEFSLVCALLEQVEAHVPPAGRVLRVKVRAGASRAIEPELMRWAWRAATGGTRCADAALELELLPWRLRCPACGATFDADDPLAPCACGCETTRPLPDDELTLVSVTLCEDDPSLDPRSPGDPEEVSR